MPNTSLAFRLTSPLFHEKNTPASKSPALTTTPVLYVYTPEHSAHQVAKILNRYRIAHRINDYGLQDVRNKTFCYCQGDTLNAMQRAILAKAKQAGSSVESLLAYLEQHLQHVEVELLHDERQLLRGLPKSSAAQQYAKRAFDIVLSLGLLLLTLPLWAIVALAIKLESAGPVFFSQRRTGLNNHEFTIFKFRSMYQDAEKDGARWASRHDSRITRVGAFLRKTRIDELPQLINVLKGEMSLIGPRPEREVFIRELEQHVPFYRFRHRVKPGITGLAQVRYTYGASIQDAMHKHRHDLYYIKHQSLALDLHILWKTVRVVLTGQGV